MNQIQSLPSLAELEALRKQYLFEIQKDNLPEKAIIVAYCLGKRQQVPSIHRSTCHWRWSDNQLEINFYLRSMFYSPQINDFEKKRTLNIIIAGEFWAHLVWLSSSNDSWLFVEDDRNDQTFVVPGDWCQKVLDLYPAAKAKQDELKKLEHWDERQQLAKLLRVQE